MRRPLPIPAPLRSLCLPCLLAVGLTLSGCGVPNELELGGRVDGLCGDGQLALAINSTGKVPEGCTKIEGSQIGQAPQTLAIEGGTVTLTGWTDKSGQAGEKVGFTFTATLPVKYAVKAATRTFVGTSSSWLHPDGTSGPAANGISNVTFCPDGAADAGTPGGGGADAGSGDEDAGQGSGGDPDAGTGGPGAGDGGTPGEECPPTSGGGTDAGTGSPDAGSGGGGGLDGGSAPCSADADCGAGWTCVAGACYPSIG